MILPRTDFTNPVSKTFAVTDEDMHNPFRGNDNTIYAYIDTCIYLTHKGHTSIWHLVVYVDLKCKKHCFFFSCK